MCDILDDEELNVQKLRRIKKKSVKISNVALDIGRFHHNNVQLSFVESNNAAQIELIWFGIRHRMQIKLWDIAVLKFVDKSKRKIH